MACSANDNCQLEIKLESLECLLRVILVMLKWEDSPITDSTIPWVEDPGTRRVGKE